MSTKTRNKSKSEPEAASKSHWKSSGCTFQYGSKGPTQSTPSLDPLGSTEHDSQPPARVSVFRSQLAEDIKEKFNTKLDALQHDL